MKRTLSALTTMALAAGCTSAASSTHPGGRRPPPPHRTIHLGWAQRGQDVRVHVGDRIELRLPSTYWVVDPAESDALTVIAHAVHPTRAHCVPGGGCGSIAVAYRAAHAGRVTLQAHRSSCGEAMRCTGPRGAFTVGIVVR